MDGSFYCGISINVVKRIVAHNTGKGAKYTRSRLPVFFRVISYPMSKSAALKLEYQVKKQKKCNKINFLKEYKMGSEDTVYISKVELTRLQEVDAKMDALEAAGVDNWEGYEYAMEILHEKEDS
jgi:putative endonuclease